MADVTKGADRAIMVERHHRVKEATKIKVKSGLKRGKYSHVSCVRCKLQKKKCSGELPCTRCTQKGYGDECLQGGLLVKGKVVKCLENRGRTAADVSVTICTTRLSSMWNLDAALSLSYTRLELLQTFSLEVAPIHVPVADDASKMHPQMQYIIMDQFQEEWWTTGSAPRHTALLAEVFASVSLNALGETSTSRQICVQAAPALVEFSMDPEVEITHGFLHAMFSVSMMLMYQSPALVTVVLGRVLEILETQIAPGIEPLVASLARMQCQETLRRISPVQGLRSQAQQLYKLCDAHVPTIGGISGHEVTAEAVQAMTIQERDRALLTVRRSMLAVTYRIIELTNGKALWAADTEVRGLHGVCDECWHWGFMHTFMEEQRQSSSDRNWSSDSFESEPHQPSIYLSLGDSFSEHVVQNCEELRLLLTDVGACMRATSMLVDMNGIDYGDHANKRFRAISNETIFLCRVSAIILLHSVGEAAAAAECARDFARNALTLDFKGGGSTGSYVIPLAMLVNYAWETRDYKLMTDLHDMAKNLASSWEVYPDVRRQALVVLAKHFLDKLSASP